MEAIISSANLSGVSDTSSPAAAAALENVAVLAGRRKRMQAVVEYIWMPMPEEIRGALQEIFWHFLISVFLIICLNILGFLVDHSEISQKYLPFTNITTSEIFFALDMIMGVTIISLPFVRYVTVSCAKIAKETVKAWQNG